MGLISCAIEMDMPVDIANRTPVFILEGEKITGKATRISAGGRYSCFVNNIPPANKPTVISGITEFVCNV